MASSASMEQWSLTGGRLKYFAISVFLILLASSMSIPLTLWFSVRFWFSFFWLYLGVLDLACLNYSLHPVQGLGSRV